MSGSSLRSRALMEGVLWRSPSFRPLISISRQMSILFVTFEVDADRREPWETRIRDSVKSRAGAHVEAALYERAEKLGLLRRPHNGGISDDDARLADRLEAARRLADPATAAGYDAWIEQMRGARHP